MSRLGPKFTLWCHSRVNGTTRPVDPATGSQALQDWGSEPTSPHGNDSMKFCSNCGAPDIEYRVPAGDNRQRHVCPRCDTVFYDNPRVVAGTIPVWEDRILLCRRAIEPRLGYWTLPAGFMENAESTFDAAVRETLEEANAHVENLALYTVFSLPHVNQVYMMFRAELRDLHFSAGTESLEVKLMCQSEIPWGELAFPTIHHTLEHYFQDRERGVFPVRTGDIVRGETGAEYRVR